MINEFFILSLFIGLLSLTYIAHAEIDRHTLKTSYELNSLSEQKRFIQKIYADISQNYHNYTLTEIDNPDLSTEGGSINIYTDQNEVRFIEEIYFGETGKLSLQYYFYKNHLYFVLQQDTTYNAPITYTVARATKYGEEPFDPEKSTVKEDRFYFYNGKMIQWLDNNKRSIPNESSSFLQKQNYLLQQVQLNLNKFKAQ